MAKGRRKRKIHCDVICYGTTFLPTQKAKPAPGSLLFGNGIAVRDVEILRSGVWMVRCFGGEVLVATSH